MAEKSRNFTKEKIMKVAVEMFSERGFRSVSTREIAKAADINPASIYYYFSSKNDILKSLYKFYIDKQNQAAPDFGQLKQLVQDCSAHEVLMKAEYHYKEGEREMLDQILITAAREICSDPASEQFIRESIFDSVDNGLRPLLQQMIDLGKLKPFDLDIFIRVVSNYCFSTASLNNSVFRQGVSEYQEGMAYLFSSVLQFNVEQGLNKGGELYETNNA